MRNCQPRWTSTRSQFGRSLHGRVRFGGLSRAPVYFFRLGDGAGPGAPGPTAAPAGPVPPAVTPDAPLATGVVRRPHGPLPGRGAGHSGGGGGGPPGRASRCPLCKISGPRFLYPADLTSLDCWGPRNQMTAIGQREKRFVEGPASNRESQHSDADELSVAVG